MGSKKIPTRARVYDLEEIPQYANTKREGLLEYFQGDTDFSN